MPNHRRSRRGVERERSMHRLYKGHPLSAHVVLCFTGCAMAIRWMQDRFDGKPTRAQPGQPHVETVLTSLDTSDASLTWVGSARPICRICSRIIISGQVATGGMILTRCTRPDRGRSGSRFLTTVGANFSFCDAFMLSMHMILRCLKVLAQRAKRGSQPWRAVNLPADQCARDPPARRRRAAAVSLPRPAMNLRNGAASTDHCCRLLGTTGERGARLTSLHDDVGEFTPIRVATKASRIRLASPGAMRIGRRSRHRRAKYLRSGRQLGLAKAASHRLRVPKAIRIPPTEVSW